MISVWFGGHHLRHCRHRASSCIIMMWSRAAANARCSRRMVNALLLAEMIDHDPPAPSPSGWTGVAGAIVDSGTVLPVNAGLCYCDAAPADVRHQRRPNHNERGALIMATNKRTPITPVIEMTGRFGRLTVLERALTNRRGYAWWVCRCDCGKICEARGDHLRAGRHRSCGCLRREEFGVRAGTSRLRHGDGSVVRGVAAEYYCWNHMKQRCRNPHASSWDRYGGRGISVCARWLESYENFLADMGRKPSPEHSIDRIDNDGNYAPGNCRWATRSEQMRNQRPRRPVKLGGNSRVVLVALPGGQWKLGRRSKSGSGETTVPPNRMDSGVD